MASLGEAAQQLRALEASGGLAVGPVGDGGGGGGGHGAEGAQDVGGTEGGEQQALWLRVERCLTLLRLFVEEVENKAGSCGRSQRHGTAARGLPMRVQVTVVGGSNTPKLEVGTDSSQTIGSLRSRIWQELGQHGEWQRRRRACCG